MKADLTINGTAYTVACAGERTLLTALHNELGLTGTGFHCLQGHCGSCTVLVDGKPRRACITPVSAIAGARIVTVEGICAAGHPLHAAFTAAGLLDCTGCSSGQLVCAAAQLQENAVLDGDALMACLSENICYCLRYDDIRHALRSAVNASGAAPTTPR